MKFKIFPPIGIARLGDSETEWFIGPERPGAYEAPVGGYKSADCRLKRQGARFRIFAFEDDGKTPILENGSPKEITLAQAQITWTVQLANTKAAAFRFKEPGRRNTKVKPEAARQVLKIVTEEASIAGPNAAVQFQQGAFRGLPVKLGELLTDEDGRLIVLGGHGQARCVTEAGWQPNATADYGNLYDHNDWHDDTADGPVRASLVMDGVVHPVAAARVVVSPPAFAPSIQPIVSLYDRLLPVMNQTFKLPPAQGPVSFTQDIYPILRRTLHVGRVFDVPEWGHGAIAKAIADPTLNPASIVGALTPPPGSTPVPGPGSQNMPKLLGDDKTPHLTLTPLQYETMRAWLGQEGVTWINDWTGQPPEPSPTVTPDGLTRAALEACVGGGFRPGIEAGRYLVYPPKPFLPGPDEDPAPPVDAERFVEPFRLRDDIPAGAVTEQMAVPWQGDFWYCKTEGAGWWPTHRPDIAFLEGGGQEDWFPDKGGFLGAAKYLMESLGELGVIAERNGQLVQTEKTVECRHISIVVRRDTISRATAEAAADGLVKGVLTVRLHGAAPADLGLDGPGPFNLDAIAPALKFAATDGSEIKGLGYKVTEYKLQKEQKDTVQILAFEVDLVFSSLDAFTANGLAIEEQAIFVTAFKAWKEVGTGAARDASGDGGLTLTNIPQPFIFDGDVPWLAEDLRVFRVLAGDDPIAGAGKLGDGPGAPLNYIQAVVAALNGHGPAGNPFDKLDPNHPNAALQLFPTEAGKAVHNFAVVRVRYDGQAQPAPDVRVFFRLFTTAATGFDYDPEHAYRRSLDLDAPIALLGHDGANKLITFPCFGRARVDSGAVGLATQKDDLNVRTLNPPPPGQTQTHAYFGCWIDINQPNKLFPAYLDKPDGPWPEDQRKTLVELLGSDHQCLVAEVFSPDHPIKDKVTPGGDGRIAQRNLVWVESDNPGGPETRTIQHSLLIKAPDRAPAGPGQDELVIDWSGLPAGCRMSLYMPDVEASEVYGLARSTLNYPGIRPLDAHTLDCLPGGVTYIPLPAGRAQDIAALLTIVLPEGVRKGQQFQARVEQVDPRRRVRGTVQINIPISVARDLLGPEEKRLSLLRFMEQAKAPDDPWRAVLRRYVEQVAARVKGFGGNPDVIAPSATGEGKPNGWKGTVCAILAGLLLLSVAGLLVAAALHPPPAFLLEAVFAVSGLLFGLIWLLICKPKPWRIFGAVGGGALLGAGLLGVLALFGAGGVGVVPWLAAASALAALLLAAAAALFTSSP